MKNILNNAIKLLVFVLLITSMILYLKLNIETEKRKKEVLRNEQLVSVCDSISKLPPDTIKSEPIYVKGKDSIVYVKVYSEPTESTRLYKDSIKNDSTHIEYEIEADNLVKVRFNVKPIYKYQETIIEKYVPKPVNIIERVEVQKRGLYATAGLGIGDNVSLGVGLTYVTRNDQMFSYSINRIEGRNIHVVTYGVRLFK